MNQTLSVTPNTAPPEPEGEAPARSAPQQAEVAEFAALPLPELLQQLHSRDSGLSASEAAAILDAVGPNRIESVKQKSLLADLIARLGNPLVLILLGAATISAFTGDVASFLIITVIVLGSVILDVAQERRAQNAADRLREQVSLAATALREGKPVDIPAEEVVVSWRCMA